MEPVPPGITGELYLGGTGLARGYWKQPQFTAERFLPDALSGDSGSRLYRTGDLVRWLPQGRLEFVGRADEQVKIRGFRIEPGEIEAVLRQDSAVQNGAVVVKTDSAEEKHLIAYVTGNVVIQDLRTFLKERLPEYMVPQAIVILPELPLTANGKVDRKALPEPETMGHESISDYVAAETEKEKAIAQVWLEILRLDKVGMNDNFFEMGGTSLSILRLRDKLEMLLGRSIPVADLFQHPTIAYFCHYLTQQDAEVRFFEAENRATVRRERLKQRSKRAVLNYSPHSVVN
jgi:acyl carrier protein